MASLRFAAIPLLACLAAPAAAATTAPPRPPRAEPEPDYPKQIDWIEVVPAPEPRGLPLMGPDGLTADGTPRAVVDRAALRSLLVRKRFPQLTKVFEAFQDRFEKDPRFEIWLWDAFDSLGYSHARERELIDAWLAATPASFAPRVASARYWLWMGLLQRGDRWARETSEEEFRLMRQSFGRAAEDAQAAQRIRPKSVYAASILISLATRLGAGDAVAQLYERSARDCPTCYELARERMEALEPRWGGSMREYEEFVGSRPVAKSPRLRLLRGFLLLEQARQAREDLRVDDARALIDSACRLGGDWRFFVERADFNWAGDPKPVLADLDRANELHPGLSEVLARRASVYARLERWEEAGRDLLYVLRARPRSVTGIRIYATVLEAVRALSWKEGEAGRPKASARLAALAADLSGGSALPADRGTESSRELSGAEAAADPGGSLLPDGAPSSGDVRPSLRLRVVDAEGRPVASAAIVLLEGAQDASGIFRSLDGVPVTGRTDGTGWLEVPTKAGRHTVVVKPTAGAPGIVRLVEVSPRGSPTELRIGQRRHLLAQVRAPGGPAGGARIVALPDDLSPGRECGASEATSGADGALRLDGLGTCRYVLFARGGGFAGRSAQSSPALEQGEEGRPIVLWVQAKITLRGRVLLSAAGEPARPADTFTVTARAKGGKFGGEDGAFSFEIDGGKGFVELTIEAAERPTLYRKVTVQEGVNDLGELVVGPGRLLRGQVRSPNGGAASYAKVGYHGTVLTGMADARGRFELRIQEDADRLIVRHERYRWFERPLAPGEDEVDVLLEPGASLIVRVTDETGHAVPAAQVSSWGGAPTAAHPASCQTDGGGRCTLEGLDLGSHLLTLSGGRGIAPRPDRTLYVPVRSMSPQEVQFRWSDTPTQVRFQVAVGPGQPNRVDVRVFPGEPPFVQTTDEKGDGLIPYYYAGGGLPLGGLPTGSYRAVARTSWGCSTALFEIRPGDNEVALRMGDGSCR